jgi:hypothetical protein
MHHERMRFKLQDTGPGFGISLSYGRLRESCQTDMDGTPIGTLEEVAGRLTTYQFVSNHGFSAFQ